MPKSHDSDWEKNEEENLFRRKQEAWKEFDLAREQTKEAYRKMQVAWEKRIQAREVMNHEFNLRKAAFEQLDKIWKEYCEIRDTNNALIEVTKIEADAYHQKMKECFNLAGEAYRAGRKSEATRWSKEGHEHKEKRDRLNMEIKQFGTIIRNARDYAKSISPKVDSNPFRQARAIYEEAKAEHEIALAEFKNKKDRKEWLDTQFKELDKAYKQLK